MYIITTPTYFTNLIQIAEETTTHGSTTNEDEKPPCAYLSNPMNYHKCQQNQINEQTKYSNPPKQTMNHDRKIQ